MLKGEALIKEVKQEAEDGSSLQRTREDSIPSQTSWKGERVLLTVTPVLAMVCVQCCLVIE